MPPSGRVGTQRAIAPAKLVRVRGRFRRFISNLDDLLSRLAATRSNEVGSRAHLPVILDQGPGVHNELHRVWLWDEWPWPLGLTPGSTSSPRTVADWPTKALSQPAG